MDTLLLSPQLEGFGDGIALPQDPAELARCAALIDRAKAIMFEETRLAQFLFLRQYDEAEKLVVDAEQVYSLYVRGKNAGGKHDDMCAVAHAHGKEALERLVVALEQDVARRQAKEAQPRTIKTSASPSPSVLVPAVNPDDIRRRDFNRSIAHFEQEISRLRVIFQTKPREMLARLTWEIFGTSDWKKLARELEYEIAGSKQARKRSRQ